MGNISIRGHAQAIDDFGGAQRVVEALQKIGVSAKPVTVRAWRARDSVPAEYWSALAAAEIATLDELAAAAARRNSQKEAA